jgi:hypothetical protein
MELENLIQSMKNVLADLETQDVGWEKGSVETAMSVIKTRIWELENQDKMISPDTIREFVELNIIGIEDKYE